MTPIRATAAALLLAATPAAAQQVTGQIAATLDGETRGWFITETEEMSQSDWSGTPEWAMVSLLGHTTPDTIMNSREALMIGFTATGPGPATDVEIRFLAEGLSKAYVAKEDNAAVTIESLSAKGDRLSLSGSFTATMGYTEDFGRTIDMANSRAIEGTFEADIGPVR